MPLHSQREGAGEGRQARAQRRRGRGQGQAGGGGRVCRGCEARARAGAGEATARHERRLRPADSAPQTAPRRQRPADSAPQTAPHAPCRARKAQKARWPLQPREAARAAGAAARRDGGILQGKGAREAEERGQHAHHCSRQGGASKRSSGVPELRLRRFWAGGGHWHWHTVSLAAPYLAAAAGLSRGSLASPAPRGPWAPRR